MNKMSKDEATEKLKQLVIRCKDCKFATCENCEINWNEVQAIETILDLYKKEKEKNKELEDENTKLSEEIIENICKGAEEDVLEEYRQQVKNSISKDKIRAKIEELDALKHNDNRLDRVSVDFSINKFKELLEEK